MTQENKYFEGWQKTPLGEIADIEIGHKKAIREIIQTEGDIPFIFSGDLKNTKEIQVKSYITKNQIISANINPEEKVYTKERLLLAMARLGTAGRIGIFRAAAIHNQGTAAIIPKVENNIDIDFLFYYFYYRRHIVAMEVEKGGKPRITKEHLKSLPIPIPPGGMEEEKRIVQQLEARLKEVEQGYKLIKNIKQEIANTFNTALFDVFTPKRIARWPSINKPKLKMLVEEIKGKTIPQTSQHGQYLYIDETHITRERGQLHTRITWQEQQGDEERSIILLEQALNVVLYYKSNVLARLAVLLDADKAICSTTMIPLRIREDSREKLLPEFLLWSLLSQQFLAFVTINKHNGKTNTSPSANKMFSYELPLPDIDTQRSLINHIKRVQEITYEMQEKADDSRNKMTLVEQAIFQKAFQGEL